MNTLEERFPSDDLLAQCAQHWHLKNIVFVRKMENMVFSCDSPSGKVYLRLTTPLRRAKPEIEAEAHWIEHLEKWGMKVPHLIPDRAGKKIVSFTEGPQHYEAVVFSEITGKHPDEAVATSPQFLRTLGSLIAKMHLASQSYESAHLGIKREEWFEERGLRHALTAAASSKEIQLRNRLESAIAWLKQLPCTSDKYGLVHADLGALNMFVEEDDTVGIIDFDDSCYHWFAFDLAIVIFSMAGRLKHTSPSPEETRWLSDLVSGYRTVRSVSEKELSYIPRFINFALLRLFFWIEYHETLGTFHKDALEKVVHQKQWAKARVECGL
jgi:amicoumacin kinase